MLGFVQSLLNGFKFIPHGETNAIFITPDGAEVIPPGYFSFKFGEENKYELAFEPLLKNNMFYVSLYEDGKQLVNKVPISTNVEKPQNPIDVT
jgi:hypothetical protein